jgi:hypothetical protein
MYHRNYTTCLQKELDFLKLLVSRFHEQDKVNELELNVAMQKTQDIYEQFLKIKLLPDAETIENPAFFKPERSATVTVEEKVTAPEPVTEQPKAATPRKKPAPKPEPEPVFIPAPEETEEPEETFEETIVWEEPKPVKKEKSAVTHREEKPQQPVTPKVSILAERLSPAEATHINETLAQQKTGSDLSSKLQTSPLPSIASGIGINDKFLYIRELFSGDSDTYNRTVKKLDSAGSLDDALEFIQTNFNWDEKDGTVAKFVNLVYRRYA